MKMGICCASIMKQWKSGFRVDPETGPQEKRFCASSTKQAAGLAFGQTQQFNQPPGGIHVPHVEGVPSST